jgi:glycosyltransferase involved in cell wall biosynthesis
MPHTLEGHRAIVSRVDGVICTTDRLAQAYRSLNPNVYVCPNSIDPEDWPPIEKPDDGIFRIGWYASHSHADDGQLIRRGMEWASRQKNVEVVTMGHHPNWTFPHRHIPWSNDLATYWKAMEILDVGVCPVRPNLWSECRSDVKALEYAMGGAAPILSGEAPYEAWENERGCLKARTAKGFYESIKRLVKDREETKQLAMEAKEYVLSKRTIKDNIASWRNAVHGV